MHDWIKIWNKWIHCISLSLSRSRSWSICIAIVLCHHRNNSGWWCASPSVNLLNWLINLDFISKYTLIAEIIAHYIPAQIDEANFFRRFLLQKSGNIWWKRKKISSAKIIPGSFPVHKYTLVWKRTSNQNQTHTYHRYMD